MKSCTSLFYPSWDTSHPCPHTECIGCPPVSNLVGKSINRNFYIVAGSDTDLGARQCFCVYKQAQTANTYAKECRAAQLL